MLRTSHLLLQKLIHSLGHLQLMVKLISWKMRPMHQLPLTYNLICPSRPIRPFCTPEVDDPFKERVQQKLKLLKSYTFIPVISP